MSDRDLDRHICEYSNQAVNWWLELDADSDKTEWTIERQQCLQHVVSQCMEKLRYAVDRPQTN